MELDRAGTSHVLPCTFMLVTEAPPVVSELIWKGHDSEAYPVRASNYNGYRICPTLRPTVAFDYEIS
jgi:hypothetical protein